MHCRAVHLCSKLQANFLICKKVLLSIIIKRAFCLINRTYKEPLAIF